MANLLMLLIAAILVGAVGHIFVGLVGLTLIAFVLALLWLGKGLKLKFASSMPGNEKQSAWIAGILLVSLFAFGAFSIFGLDISTVTATIGIPVGPIAPATIGITVPPAAALDACSESVSEELRGKTSTVTYSGIDAEAQSSAEVNFPVRAYNSKGALLVNNVGSTAASVATTVGQVITTYGGNSTGTGNGYYMDGPVVECIDAQADVISITGHKWATEANLQTTCFKDDGVTELDSPTGTYPPDQKDYAIDVGSDEDYNYFCRMKVNGAKQSYQLCGVAIKPYEGTANTLDDVKMQESGWSIAAVPRYLRGSISLNSTARTDNITGGYDKLYTFGVGPNAILLSQWQSVKYSYVAEIGPSAPSAVDSASPTASTQVMMIHSDCAWIRGSNGNEFFDLQDHTSTEGNVGLTETTDNPYGKQSGVVIEFI